MDEEDTREKTPDIMAVLRQWTAVCQSNREGLSDLRVQYLGLKSILEAAVADLGTVAERLSDLDARISALDRRLAGLERAIAPRPAS